MIAGNKFGIIEFMILYKWNSGNRFFGFNKIFCPVIHLFLLLL